MTEAAWFDDALLYQIYPASFSDSDSDGDGYGDLRGIMERLDYLAWLGVNTVWLSPCYPSPRRDGGYDVSDYYSVDSRFGTDEDLDHLVAEARRRGIRVLLDLVPGHTSDQHPWFTESADGRDAGIERYIWAPEPVDGFVLGPGRRSGWYLPNYFDHQPALNYGYARPEPSQPWRQPVDAPGPRANRRMLRDVMDHWLRRGVSGFRVDMALSLVKDDLDHLETIKLWREVRAWLQTTHPDAVLIAEGGRPEISLRAGFHGDFFLAFGNATLQELWNNGEGHWPADGPCYFHRNGAGSLSGFLYDWGAVEGNAMGNAVLPTSNHDFNRFAAGSRTGDQLKAALTFALTWPTVPAIYQGDEIGMRYVPQTLDLEGSLAPRGFNRAASRTPMQWSQGPNAGFSTAPAEQLYLPVDPDPDRPTVAAQRADDSSLLHWTRHLIALRRNHEALGTRGSLTVHHSGYPLVYERAASDERFLVVVNPSDRVVSAPVRAEPPGELLAGAGVRTDGMRVVADAFGHAVLRLSVGTPDDVPSFASSSGNTGFPIVANHGGKEALRTAETNHIAITDWQSPTPADLEKLDNVVTNGQMAEGAQR